MNHPLTIGAHRGPARVNEPRGCHDVAAIGACYPIWGEVRHPCGGPMNMDRVWDIEVNWIRFFDATLLITGIISVLSVATVFI